MREIFNYIHDAKRRRREIGQIGHQFSGLARPSGRVHRTSQTSQMSPTFPSEEWEDNRQIGRQFSVRADPPFASSIEAAGRSGGRRQMTLASFFRRKFSAVGRWILVAGILRFLPEALTRYPIALDLFWTSSLPQEERTSRHMERNLSRDEPYLQKREAPFRWRWRAC
uniref:Uncharacterized protein n=1 Tax=Fusarium solani TaxID=169388 RepID=Q01439_FUSSL|nr:unknown protein [Fusarium haematococcum]